MRAVPGLTSPPVGGGTSSTAGRPMGRAGRRTVGQRSGSGRPGDRGGRRARRRDRRPGRRPRARCPGEVRGQ